MELDNFDKAANLAEEAELAAVNGNFERAFTLLKIGFMALGRSYSETINSANEVLELHRADSSKLHKVIDDYKALVDQMIDNQKRSLANQGIAIVTNKSKR